MENGLVCRPSGLVQRQSTSGRRSAAQVCGQRAYVLQPASPDYWRIWSFVTVRVYFAANVSCSWYFSRQCSCSARVCRPSVNCQLLMWLRARSILSIRAFSRQPAGTPCFSQMSPLPATSPCRHRHPKSSRENCAKAQRRGQLPAVSEPWSMSVRPRADATI